jgi:hypothetical protein
VFLCVQRRSLALSAPSTGLLTNKKEQPPDDRAKATAANRPNPMPTENDTIENGCAPHFFREIAADASACRGRVAP